jgi:hypothetical protein
MEEQAKRSGRMLSVISLGLSLSACLIALTAYQDTDGAARRALRLREMELIEHYHPRLKQMADDIDFANYPEHPRSIEEALAPIEAMIEAISSTKL